MKKLKKVYVEITNICNLKCSFCHGTKRTKRFMSTGEFSVIAEKIKPHTDYVYLHLMGEPLLHPDLDKIIGICGQNELKATITTNGTLIGNRETLLTEKDNSVYKIVVSLHSFEANELTVEIDEYIRNVCSVLKKAADKGKICVMRLWNEGGENSMNNEIIELLHSVFTGEITETRNGEKLSDKIYLEYGDRFEWPDDSAPAAPAVFCMALRDQAGILCDGTVVPCCLDADGAINLGNIFNDDFESILTSERATNLYNGFSCGKAVENLCNRCGYASVRFGK